ncbi:MAG: amino acid adenylation domain-containing protein, partial [Acidobacteriota bacterium]
SGKPHDPDAGQAPERPPLHPAERHRHPPLSFAQERLWFLDRLRAGEPLYNLAAAYRLRGDLHLPALVGALSEVERRHEVLRTTYREEEGEPVQVVHPPRHPAVPVVDLSSLPPADREREVRCLARLEGRRPFDLEAGPVVRYRVVRLGPAEHAALVTLHHIAGDGWSVGVLTRELNTLYEAHRTGVEPALPDLPIQYADFAVWQRGWLGGEVLEREVDHWRRHLSGAPPVLELPADRPRPKIQSSLGALHRFRVPAELGRGLRELAHREGTTLFTVLLSGFLVLLHRLSGQDDLVTGTAVANRTPRETEPLVGFFVNTLPLRLDLSGNPTAAELIRQAREVALDAFAHQEVPFEKLVERLNPSRDLVHTPIFQNLIALQNASAPSLELPGLVCDGLETDTGTAKFDLSLIVEPEPEEGPEAGALDGLLEYAVALFDRTTVRRTAAHLLNLLEALVAAPGRRVSELPLLSAAERRQLLDRNPGTERFPEDTLASRFAARAREAPDRIATSFERRHLSYGELQRRSSELADGLRAQGIGPEDRVGLLVERSSDLVAAILAVLESGAAYVPLDPSWPQERLDFVRRDAGLRALLVQGALADRVDAEEIRVVALDGPTPAGRPEGEPPPVHAGVDPDHLAYVIYTSGSTGRPKGTLIRHGSVTRLLDATAEWAQAGHEDVWSLFHSSAFDFSVWELWGALAFGGRLVVVPYWVARAPESFHELLERERVTVLNQTPSAFRQLSEADAAPDRGETLPALRLVIFGGEALEPSTLSGWLERHGRRPRLVNMYGITETTVHVTRREIRNGDLGGRVGSPIGTAIPDLSLQLLDGRGSPVPVGVPGEIHVGGPGLARGYLGRPRLTAERFVPDPQGGAPGARLYRSGDLARHLPDGDLEYLGRIDHQIKIRGFRVELGEIEEALAGHPAVEDAVVTLQEDRDGDQRLVAHVVPDGERAPVLRRYARLEREGRVDDLQMIELSDDLGVFHLNRGETEALGRELLDGEARPLHGAALGDGARIFDVGAHVGLFALSLALRWRDLEIFAFEPLPPVFEALESNVELHGLGARCFCHALGAETSRAAFDYYPHATLLSGRSDLQPADAETRERAVVRTLKRQAEGEGLALEEAELEGLLADRLEHQRFVCPVKPLSQVIRETGVETIDLLKVDAGRTGLQIFDGIDEEHWPLIRSLVVEVQDIEDRAATLRRLLETRGFRVTAEPAERPDGGKLLNVYGVRPSVDEPASARGGADRPRPGRPQAPAVAHGGPAAFVRSLRDHCVERLPEYMVPAAYVPLDAFPLTANGKIDRRALARDVKALAGTPGRIVAPRTRTETRLADIWRDLLGVDRVGVHSDFFELGGHSLLATRLVSRIREEMGVELGLRTFFESPTLEAVAREIDRSPAREESPSRPRIRALRRGGRSLNTLRSGAVPAGETGGGASSEESGE